MSIKTRTDLLPDVAPPSLSSTIDADVANGFKLDRYLGDTLLLPYDFEAIRVRPNELCVSDNINASLYKIYYNFESFILYCFFLLLLEYPFFF